MMYEYKSRRHSLMMMNDASSKSSLGIRRFDIVSQIHLMKVYHFNYIL